MGLQVPFAPYLSVFFVVVFFFTCMYSKGPSSRPGPVLGHFLFNVYF